MKTLAPLLEAVEAKQKLEEELAALQKTEKALTAELRDLEAADEAAQEALQQLTGVSGKAILFRLTGKHAEALERQQAEARRAAILLEQTRGRAAATADRIQAVEAELETFADADLACFQAVSAAAVGHPLHDALQAAGEALARISQQESALRQTCSAADALKATLEQAEVTATHGDIQTTMTGVRYNNKEHTLQRQLPLCQQGMNALLEQLEAYKADIEVHRISCYGGSAFTEPLTDFTLQSRLSDAVFQLRILKKQLLRLSVDLASQKAEQTETLRSLLLQITAALQV